MPRCICVECGAPVSALVRDYGKGNLRLTICSVCNAVADKYVEYETIVLFLDVLLLKPPVYRHVLCNLPAPVSLRTTLKLFVILVMLDMNLKAYLVDQDAGVTFRATSMYKMPDATRPFLTSGRRIGQFALHLLCLSLLENVVYFASVFAGIWLDPFRRQWRVKLQTNGHEARVENTSDAPWMRCSSALCIASFGKLFALMTVIWEVHWSFVHVIGALVVVSNVLALQLLLGEQDPAHATSLHVVAVVAGGTVAKAAAQLALYAMGNSVLFHVLV
uniref:Protein ARV n=1 Tax=Peronospora matthiolae TaxID=2874970 RepID=A0AAV1UKV8_9STRA